MRGSFLACLGTLLSLFLFAAAPDAASRDEKLLKQHKVPTDGPGLLDYLRKRFHTPLTDEKIAELIEQLGDDSFERREEATRALVLLGVGAKKQLLAALKHVDLEIRYRAELCLKQIEKNGISVQLLVSAVRVLAQRKPAGAAALLLNQFPALGDEGLMHEFHEALALLAIREGKADPALVSALTDRLAIKRSVAAVALSKARAVEQLPALRKLLADPDVDVRLAVALALVRIHEKEAVPVLIASLDQPISSRYGQVEELLFHLAGEKSPSLADSDLTSRKRYRRDWEAWWKANKDRIDLTTLSEKTKVLGRTVVVLLDDNEVIDLDENNKVRWKIPGLRLPLDVQPLPGDRVLIAEHMGNRVTERNAKGEVVWEKRFAEPLTAQRLANGHTMIASKDRLVEIERSGKEVFSYMPPAGGQIMRATKLPGGDIALITQLGVTRFVRLNRFGKEIKSFGVEVGTFGGRVGITATGNVLIPEMYNNRILEYDGTGRIVREIGAQQPIACTVLPNGNVLVTSMSQRRAVELDREGKEVWEFRHITRVTRAIRY
jgi:HEAT repeat protein